MNTTRASILSLGSLAVCLALSLCGASAAAQEGTPAGTPTAAVTATEPSAPSEVALTPNAPPAETETETATETAAETDTTETDTTETDTTETDTTETDTTETDTTSLRTRSPHRVAVSVGFSHWFSPRLGSPVGMTTPSLMVGVRPGVDLLELRVRYSIALVPLVVPAGSTEHVGFATLEVVVNPGASWTGQAIDFHAGLFGGIVHGGFVSGCGGLVVGAAHTFDLPGGVAIGPYFETRMFIYAMPGDHFQFPERIESDLQLDLGATVTFS